MSNTQNVNLQISHFLARKAEQFPDLFEDKMIIKRGMLSKHIVPLHFNNHKIHTI